MSALPRLGGLGGPRHPPPQFGLCHDLAGMPGRLCAHTLPVMPLLPLKHVQSPTGEGASVEKPPSKDDLHGAPDSP